MKKDIFEQAKTTAKETVIFEINDTNRQHEYKAGHDYVEAFIGFLESLGFEPTRKYEHSSNVIIDGVEFGIGTDNASYMSKQQFTRDRVVRKPQNRFVSLDKGWQSVAARVFINVETDADRLKSRIRKAIDDAKQKDQDHQDRKKETTKNAIAIGQHYCQLAFVRDFVSTISIHEGMIGFVLRGPGSVYITPDGSFKKASAHFSEMDSLGKFRDGLQDMRNSIDLLEILTTYIIGHKKLPSDLQAWAKDEAGHVYFNVEKQSI